MPVIRCPWIFRATAPLGVAAAMLVTNGAWAQDRARGSAAPTQTAAQALSQPPTPAKSGTFLPEELEQMVAPIALYPDPLIAQVLMSSTYPLEIVEAARWSKANPSVTGDAVEEALKDQDWDPSVKSIATFPDVLAMMDEKLDWTQKLGDAFLAQQAEVMAAVQRLRAKAKAEGTLMSSKEQTVTEEPAPPPAAPAADAAAAPAAAAPRRGGARRRDDDDHQDRARRPRSRLRADLQPNDRLRCLAVSRVSALLLLPAHVSARRGVLQLHGRRHRRRRAVGQLQLGRQRHRHQRQPQHQHQQHGINR